MESKSSAESELSRNAFLKLFVPFCFVWVSSLIWGGCYFGEMSLSQAIPASVTNLVAGILAWTIYRWINRPRIDRYFIMFMYVMPMNGNLPLWQRFLIGLVLQGTAAILVALIDRREEQKKSVWNKDPMADADLDSMTVV